MTEDLAICVWCFARFYYFAFYVIEHYTDPGYRFAGLWSFVQYMVHGLQIALANRHFAIAVVDRGNRAIDKVSVDLLLSHLVDNRLEPPPLPVDLSIDLAPPFHATV